MFHLLRGTSKIIMTYENEPILDARSGFPKFPRLKANRCVNCDNVEIHNEKVKEFRCSDC